MKVIINRDDVDFDVAESATATQEFELARTGEVQEVAVVRSPFTSYKIKC